MTAMEVMSNALGGIDHLKPSLFEVLSEQELSSLLPPSLRYLVALAAQRRPRYLLKILNSFDELYALVMLLLERYYLHTYSSGFTENFYGLKRERVLRVRGGELPRAQQAAPGVIRDCVKLSRADVWKNLTVMVVLPYIKRKLDDSHDIHVNQSSLLGTAYNGNRGILQSNATIRQRLLYYYKWFLRRIYPGINAAFYFALLAFNLGYLFDRTQYYSPFLWLIGTRIRRLGEADHRAIALAASLSSSPDFQPRNRPGSRALLSTARTISRTLYPRFLSSLRVLLPTSIFALKFLEWWHASDFARQLSRRATEGLQLSPPTVSGSHATCPVASARDLTAESSDSKSVASPSVGLSPIASDSQLPILTVLPTFSASKQLCPICLSPITAPTACQTGFIFCYACIHKWMEGKHERQIAFMEGTTDYLSNRAEEGSRRAGWESGIGRCAVTGQRLLGGIEGLRKIMI